MNIFKKIILILSVFCASAPAYGMDSNDGNQGLFGWLWNTAKEHPVAIVGSAALCAGAGLVAYRLRSLHQPLAAQENNLHVPAENNPCIDELSLQLFYAIEKNAIDEVQSLLAIGAGINTLYRDYTPLHRACRNGSVELVELLLESDADTEIKGLVGRTPLYEAVSNSRASIVRLLLDAGANVEAKNNLDWTPLHRAAQVGNVEIMRLLLDAGASLDVNADFNVYQGTPLYIAANKGHVEAVRTLLQYIPNTTMKKNRSQSQQRIVAALCAFNKLRPVLPNDLKKRILSYLPEDLISQDHANMLYNYTTNMREFVTYCPFTCLLELYKHLPSDQKEQFVEKIACALADNRLCKIEAWLKDKNLLKLDAAQIHPEIIAMLDPTTIEQHRAAIIENVRAAFLNAQSVVQGSASNDNNSNN